MHMEKRIFKRPYYYPCGCYDTNINGTYVTIKCNKHLEERGTKTTAFWNKAPTQKSSNEPDPRET